jgi:hypothetical protein
VTHRIDPQTPQIGGWLISRCGHAVRPTQAAKPGKGTCPTCRAMEGDVKSS